MASTARHISSDRAAHDSGLLVAVHPDGCRCIDCRERISGSELLRRCAKAASLELAGKDREAEREDCAATLAHLVLQRTAGALPMVGDEKCSLTFLCGMAATYRRSKDRERQRDATAAQLAADAAALTVDALAPQEQLEEQQREAEQRKRSARDERISTAARAAAAAERLAPGDANVSALVYRSLRKGEGCTDAQIARELRTTAAALRKRAERGSDSLEERSTASATLRALTGSGARQRLRWRDALTYRTTASPTRYALALPVDDGAPISRGIDYSTGDYSRAAGSRHSTAGGKLQREAGARWRDSQPTATPVTQRKVRKRSAKLASRTAQQRTAARLALRDAQRAAAQPTAHSSGSAAMRRHAGKRDNRRAGANVPDSR